MFAQMPQIGGVKLAPMPASTLPSALTVLVPVESEYGEGYGEPRTIRNVRFEKATEFAVQPSGGAQPGYVFTEGAKGLVFVDAESSEGAFEVPERAEVRVDGGEPMEAVRVNRLPNLDGTVHHWEIEVR